MKTFCIITNRDKDENMAVTKQIAKFLENRGKDVYIAKDCVAADGCHHTNADDIPVLTECAVVLGGDGTILQAAHDLAGRELPVFGINLGTLGFLAETEAAEFRSAFEKLLAGEYTVEERMMLSVKVHTKDTVVELPDAFNDLVVTRSGFSRVIGAGVYINGELVNDYRGDGVMISTPTGSTGYNLSAGGPILAPASNMMAITPICPHSLGARSIVVSDTDVVGVKVRMSKKTQDEEAIATIDGTAAVNLRAEDYIEVRRAKRTMKLIRLLERSFYQVLRAKLNGSGV